MKGIIVKDCLNCPFSDIENPENKGGILICELGKNVNCEKEELYPMVYGDYSIPNWCRLDDLQDIVDVAALEHYITYREKTHCPNCGSTDYFQPKDAIDDGLYPIFECKKCHRRWWSD